MSAAPTSLEATETIVIDGRMDPGLEAYELFAEVSFDGAAPGEHNRECETYKPYFGGRGIIYMAWVTRKFKQERGEFTRGEDGRFTFVVPLDAPTQPVCAWENMRIELFLVTDWDEEKAAPWGHFRRDDEAGEYVGGKVYPLGTLYRDYEEGEDLFVAETAVACDTEPGDTTLRCDYPGRKGEISLGVPPRSHCYELVIKKAACAGEPDFYKCLDEYADYPEEVLFQSSVCQ